MARVQNVAKLEKKFAALRQQQEKIAAAQRSVRQQMEEARMVTLDKMIKKTGFPKDKPTILIGALLEAKEKLEGEESISTINGYMQRYRVFASENPELASKLAEQEEEPAQGDVTRDGAEEGKSEL